MQTKGGEIGLTTRACFSDAPAKINLVLRVLRRRADGFHEISSVAIGVDLRDRLRMELVPTSGIELTCDNPTLTTSDNLVARVARLLAERYAITPRLHVHLSKRVPIAAGLGGGSSDAATALRLCDTIWGLGLSTEALAEVGAEVGSDVPLFFRLPAARMEGRGELVTPFPLAWSGWVLLVHVPVSVSTASAYASWRGEDTPGPVDLSPLAHVTSADALNDLLRNDLEPAVFRIAPEVERVKRYLDAMRIGDFRVSGAGSTLFRLFDTWETANRVQQVLVDNPFGCGCVLVPAPVRPGPVIHGEF